MSWRSAAVTEHDGVTVYLLAYVCFDLSALLIKTCDSILSSTKTSSQRAFYQQSLSPDSFCRNETSQVVARGGSVVTVHHTGVGGDL